ncbi:MAG: SDR family oxidoreductase [Hoeflea sp.]|uniref:SDR family oxidoreductase n=1 Tax=Hoeflea sp. TaxID=1940281 RepID=UPI001D80BAA9|nr:SDR family oxidoreductase [Hoeflea sp.]MBU4530087.1 SDR family oxidoreductase [Alphaproteobacteria bacterium]MBU4542628.1 SDR family oxidoreductase [Alphaproteobacteria bacterium]MBU4551309.1 SDR family oxidoreductase [Alphaproteobacteria bacterium]MBV1723132.1 SDR family oxidoreductase [Hoeflea sp.]MBV1760143.1 SDR family oxidoreductase [Hoeflea sp.]
MSDKGTVLVTGAGRRIGKAVATDLAAHGYHVAIHANRSGAEAEAVAASIRDAGGLAEVFLADLSDSTAVRRLHEEVSDRLGPPDIIVNNASVFQDDHVRAFDEALFDRHFAIHLKAPAILAEAMATSLPEDRDGLIVNIIDQRVWRLTPRFFSYTLSKSALWTATRTMAQALAPRIRVNAIGPGPTLANERQNADDFQRQVAAVPLGHGPDLSEFGATIRYLHQARSVTGQMIALDGGQHLAWQTPDVSGVGE